MPDHASDDLLGNLARNVRSSRLRLGWTIEELADRTDLDVLTLERIERGAGWRLTMLGLEALARALDMPAGVLLSASD